MVLHTGAAAEAALVHTLWPLTKKPKPCVQELPLQRVKCFRATILTGSCVNELAMSPTEHTWVFTPEHVLAILDVAEATISSGSIMLTASSLQALKALQATPLPVMEEKKKKGSAQPKAKAKETLARTMIQRAKLRLKKTGLTAGTDKSKSSTSAASTTEMLIGPADIRRSDRGRALIRRLISRALDLDVLRFGGNPCFNLNTQVCTWKMCPGYKRKDFLDHVPFYFQYKYTKLRNPEKYGDRVFEHMQMILHELQATDASRKALCHLIGECKSAKFSTSVEA